MVRRNQFVFTFLCILALILGGCGTPVGRQPEIVYDHPEDNPGYWEQKTTSEPSQSGNYVTYNTQSITENWPGESLRWSLRTITGTRQSESKIAHQFYFHIRYKGGWRNYQQVNVQGIAPQIITPLKKDRTNCENNCIAEEDFTLSLSTRDLKQLSNNKENRLELTSVNSQSSTLMIIPGAYIKGHLLKLIQGKVLSN